jgi:hypothetical protein
VIIKGKYLHDRGRHNLKRKARHADKMKIAQLKKT